MQDTYKVILVSDVGSIYKLVKSVFHWAPKKKDEKEVITDVLRNDKGSLSKEELDLFAAHLNEVESRVYEMERSVEELYRRVPPSKDY